MQGCDGRRIGEDLFDDLSGRETFLASASMPGVSDLIDGGSGDDLVMVATGSEGADSSSSATSTFPDQVFFTDADGAIDPRSTFFYGTLNAGIGDLVDVTGLENLRSSTRDGGVVISHGSHGSIFLQGELSVSHLAQTRNLELLSV